MIHAHSLRFTNYIILISQSNRALSVLNLYIIRCPNMICIGAGCSILGLPYQSIRDLSVCYRTMRRMRSRHGSIGIKAITSHPNTAQWLRMCTTPNVCVLNCVKRGGRCRVIINTRRILGDFIRNPHVSASCCLRYVRLRHCCLLYGNKAWQSSFACFVSALRRALQNDDLKWSTLLS